LVLLVIGYSTLLVHHIRTDFAVISDIEGKQGQYLDGGEDVEDSTDRGIYLTNLANLSVSLARMASGEINDRDAKANYLADPWLLSYPALAVLGALLAARRGNPLLLVALALAVFWPPMLSGKYKPILDGRYLMPDLPVIFVDVAVAITAIAGFVERKSQVVRLAVAAALLVGSTALVLHPLYSLERFYKESQEDGFSNATYFKTLSQLRGAGAGAETVVLDARLIEVKSAGGGRAGTNFAWLTGVSGIPSENWRLEDGPDRLVGRLAVLERRSADALKDQVHLVPLDGRRPNGRDPESYRAYRISILSR
jgi:hypothetical protein